MAQVDTRSPFRHSPSHAGFYYASASPSHSGSSSTSDSLHSSPRTSYIGSSRYSSSSHFQSTYRDDDRSYYYPPYQSNYSQTSSCAPQPASATEDASDDTSPFPAYDRAVSSHPLSPDPIVDDDEEDEEEEGEEEENYAAEPDEDVFNSPTLVNTNSPSLMPIHVEDDIWSERGPAPSRHVDYLSHDWQEPDIWSSWRYVRKEKAGFPQIATRLENASWRTWAKSMYKLKTITPEALNWYIPADTFYRLMKRLKVSDITWLYGPLKSQGGSIGRSYTEPTSPATHSPSQQMSRSSSFNASKPILKRRSHSEVILAGNVGQANLLSRAAQAIQEERRREREEREFREEKRMNPLTPSHIIRQQQLKRRKGSPELGVVNNSPASPFNVVPPCSGISSAQVVTNDKADYFGPGNWTAISLSGGHTPSAAKHIHFNDCVEQCIAIDLKDEDDQDSTAIDEESEEEGLYMRSRSRSPRPSGHRTPKLEPHSIIAKLPATTLRPGDEPVREPPQVTHCHDSFPERELEPSSEFYYAEGSSLKPSGSPPRQLSCGELDDYAIDLPFDDVELDLQPGQATPPANISSVTASRRSSRSSNLEEDGQRRESVGAIPIPYNRVIGSSDREEMMGDEEDNERLGIVGLAADAISTAKDLVGVLWHAGWGGRR